MNSATSPPNGLLSNPTIVDVGGGYADTWESMEKAVWHPSVTAWSNNA